MQERELVRLLEARVEVDYENFRPDQLPIARRVVARLATAIMRIIREEIAADRRARNFHE